MKTSTTMVLVSILAFLPTQLHAMSISICSTAQSNEDKQIINTINTNNKDINGTTYTPNTPIQRWILAPTTIGDHIKKTCKLSNKATATKENMPRFLEKNIVYIYAEENNQILTHNLNAKITLTLNDKEYNISNISGDINQNKFIRLNLENFLNENKIYPQDNDTFKITATINDPHSSQLKFEYFFQIETTTGYGLNVCSPIKLNEQADTALLRHIESGIKKGPRLSYSKNTLIKYETENKEIISKTIEKFLIESCQNATTASSIIEHSPKFENSRIIYIYLNKDTEIYTSNDVSAYLFFNGERYDITKESGDFKENGFIRLDLGAFLKRNRILPGNNDLFMVQVSTNIKGDTFFTKYFKFWNTFVGYNSSDNDNLPGFWLPINIYSIGKSDDGFTFKAQPIGIAAGYKFYDLLPFIDYFGLSLYGSWTLNISDASSSDILGTLSGLTTGFLFDFSSKIYLGIGWSFDFSKNDYCSPVFSFGTNVNLFD